MSLKTNLQTKLAAFAQQGRWQSKLVNILSAPLLWILVISGCVRAYYYSVLITTIAVDTTSYLNYHANLLKGETEGLRTPVYPYFIKLIGWVFGLQNLTDHVVIAQIILSFLSVILFYKIVQACFKKPAVVFWASLSYGVLLPVINFDKMVLTESLSVNISLLFIYLMLVYLQKPTHLKAWLLTLLVPVAILLRPSFIYLLPLIIIFWIMQLIVNRKSRRVSLSGLVASVVVMLLLVGYSHLNERNTGYNGISVVSNNNQLGEIEHAQIYPYGEDPEISAVIVANLNIRKTGKGGPGINIMKRFNPNRVHQFITTCIKNQPWAYTQYIEGKLLALQSANIFTNYANHQLNPRAFKIEKFEYLVFGVPFNLLYFFMVFVLVLILKVWIKTEQLPWFNLFLWLLAMGQIIVAIIGGYSEYPRLILPAMPALVILFFDVIDKIQYNRNHMAGITPFN